MKRLLALALVLVVAGSAFAQDPVDRATQLKVVAAADMYKANNVDGAIRAFEELYKTHPENVDVLAWLGFLYLKVDKTDAAVPLLEKAQQARPGSIDILNNLGNAYQKQGEDEKALPIYKRITEIDPKLFEGWYNLGNVQLKLSTRSIDKIDQTMVDGALNSYTKAVELKPTDPFLFNNIGVCYERKGRSDLAAQSFVKASDLRKDNKVFASNAGVTLAKARQFAQAIPYLERAIQLDPANNSTAMVLADAYSQVGKLDDAQRLYESYQSALSNNLTFWFNLGLLRERRNDLPGAEEAYRHAMDIDGTDLDVLNNYGLVLFKMKRYEQSQTIFEKLAGLDLSRKPDMRRSTRLNLAAAASKTADFDTAIRLWREHLREEPSRVDVRVSLANALWVTGDLDGAYAQFKLILGTKKDQPDALNGVGLYMLKDSKLPEAEAYFRRAIAASSGFVQAYNNLGVVLERRNKRAEAIKVWEQGLRIDASNKEIKENLARVKGSG